MSALAAVGLDRRGLIRLAILAAGLAIAAFLILRLTTDWRTLPAEAITAFHLDVRPLALAWVIQTLGWLLVVDTWRRVLVRGGAAVVSSGTTDVARVTDSTTFESVRQEAAIHLSSPAFPPRDSEVPASPPRESGPPAIQAIPYRRHLQVYAYTSLTQVLPGSIWQPMSRIALYRPLGVPALATSAAVVVEWMLLGVAGLLLYGLAAPLARGTSPEWVPLLLPLALVAVLLLHPAVFQRLVRRAARWLGQDVPPPALAVRDVAGWLLRELAVLACSGAALYLLMRAVSPAASLADAMSVWGLSVAIASLLAWLPATALIKDGSMVVLLTPLYRETGVDTGTAALIALGVTLAWRLWSVGVLLSWAALATALAGRLPGRADPGAQEAR